MERTESQNAVGCLCHEHFLFLQGFSLKRKKNHFRSLIAGNFKGSFPGKLCEANAEGLRE